MANHIQEVCKVSMQSQNPRLIQLAEEGQKWIKEASEPLVTSKIQHHSGYGLYITRELYRRNGGQFLVLSGDAGYALRPQHPESPLSEIEEFVSLPTPLEWYPIWTAISSRPPTGSAGCV